MKNKIRVIISLIIIGMILFPLQIFAYDNGVNLLNNSNSDTDKIEKFINKQMKDGMLPGLSVTIVKGDETIYAKGFGYSNMEEKKPVTSETLFELGSNSKAFTGLGVLKIADEGLIDLNEPITKYIPWLVMNYQGKAVDVTVKEFLYQTSGIPFNSINNIAVSEDDYAIEETVRTLTGIELESMPGEKFQYATINYDVLGLLIEKVTGMKYEEYIKKNILDEIGLNNTYLYRNEECIGNLARGYMIQYLKTRPYDAPRYDGNKPAGYVISCGSDMAKWLKIQMNNLEVSKFDKDIIDESHEPNRRVEPIVDGSSYASGWFIYQKGGGEISHDGANPNYSSFIIFRPEDKVGIAVLCNMNSDYVAHIANGINEILKGNEYNKEIKDFNKNVDRICSLIIFITFILIIACIYLLIRTFYEIVTKKRSLIEIGFNEILKVILSIMFVSTLLICVYLIPYTLYNGASWNLVFAWFSGSIKTALILIYACLGLLWVYYLISIFFKKRNEKSILLLSILSVASGFGNALIIFTINLAINASNSLKLKLLLYFFMGLVLYVYGQKIIRNELINITNNIVYSKRIDIIEHLLKYPYNKFEQIEKGRIESILNNDTEVISRFANICISGITSSVTLIFCFIYLGFINKYALLLSVIIILFIAGIYFIVGRFANRIGEESRDLQTIFFDFINSLIYGFKELSLNKNRRKEFKLDIEESCDKYRIKNGQSALAFANMFVIGELLFTIAIGCVVFIFPIIIKSLETSSVTSYVFILLYITGPVNGILDTIPNAILVNISFKRINGLLNDILLDDENYEDKTINLKRSFSIDLNNIEYEYKENEGKCFKVGPINYQFKSGQIVFITGGNGSGKSTLFKLITGLYPLDSGNITINGEEVNCSMLSENCSAIFSDFYLFKKLYGIDYSNKEGFISKYLKLFKLDEKVNVLNGSFSTTKLSTGQKKRLALLVSYLEDRQIYLFDEWAADQDPEFRKFFYFTLLPGLKEKGKCVIAVTHDEHYFNMADKVIKMDMGKIEAPKSYC